MKKVLGTLLFLTFMIFGISATNIVSAKSTDVQPLAGVFVEHNKMDIESTCRKNKLKLRGEFVEGNHDYLIIVGITYPIKVDFLSVTMGEERGGDTELIIGKEVFASAVLQENEAFLYSTIFPEGMPNLAVAVSTVDGKKSYAWFPRYSGVDGSIIIADGFVVLSTAKG